MANIYHYLSKALPQSLKGGKRPDYYTIAAILLVATIPAGYAVSNAALGIFAIAALSGIKKQNINFGITLLLPVILFGLMAASIIWSTDPARSAKSLSKNLPLLIMPLCLMLNPLQAGRQKIIIKYYSYAMVGYAGFYICRAIWRYLHSGDVNVFFYHELCTKDVNAIHVSLYMSVALFYFLTSKTKTALNYIIVIFLAIIILLLSSKSLIVTTFAMAGIYFLFFAPYKATVKAAVITIGMVIFAATVALVPKIRERFVIETSTMFSENTVNNQVGTENAKVYNISLNQALYSDRFKPNDYFPGVALRAFQTRVFFETMGEDNAWLTGYGLNASQQKVRDKVKQYNLYPGYGEFNFHNQYVQNWAELGFFGLLILLAILGINIKNAISRKDFVHISLAILLITLFLTESLLARQRGILFFTAFYCLFNAAEAVNTGKLR